MEFFGEPHIYFIFMALNHAEFNLKEINENELQLYGVQIYGVQPYGVVFRLIYLKSKPSS